jgi:hypothetical protein
MGEDIAAIRRDGPRGPTPQIARIAALLGELEALSRDAPQVPFPLLVQTRASIEKARGVLKDCEQSSAPAVSEEDGEGDPQPDVDNDLLERMYRDLGVGPRSPKR